MYAEFYSLSGLPFQLTPDPRFFFGSSEHNKAMAHLTYGISQGEGFIIITGDVGAGKTTLVDHLLSNLNPSSYLTAKIITTQLGGDDILRMVAAAFNLFHEGADKATLLMRLEEFALTSSTQGKRLLLVIDEAQNLSIEALEELRMLSNFVVKGVTPLQEILLAQPQFRLTLGSPNIEQLRQRVTASCHIGPMSASETRNYIEHRLKLVGWKGDPKFTDASFGEIYHFAGGIPRCINTLCSRLMLLAFLDQGHVIRKAMVVQIAQELTEELGQVIAPPVPESAMNPPSIALPLSETFTELAKRLTAVDHSVVRHDRAIRRAIRRTLDIVDKYLYGTQR